MPSKDNHIGNLVAKCASVLGVAVARRIESLSDPRAHVVCVSPCGDVDIERIEHANPDDIVGCFVPAPDEKIDRLGRRIKDAIEERLAAELGGYPGVRARRARVRGLKVAA